MPLRHSTSCGVPVATGPPGPGQAPDISRDEPVLGEQRKDMVQTMEAVEACS